MYVRAHNHNIRAPIGPIGLAARDKQFIRIVQTSSPNYWSSPGSCYQYCWRKEEQYNLPSLLPTSSVCTHTCAPHRISHLVCRDDIALPLVLIAWTFSLSLLLASTLYQIYFFLFPYQPWWVRIYISFTSQVFYHAGMQSHFPSFIFASISALLLTSINLITNKWRRYPVLYSEPFVIPFARQEIMRALTVKIPRVDSKSSGRQILD